MPSEIQVFRKFKRNDHEKFSWLILLSAIAIGGVAVKVQAQSASEESGMVNLEAMTCRELLKSEGDNRANIIIFMHGFINGKQGITTIDASALASATDKIIDSCIDSPDSKLLAVFEQNR